MLFFFSEKEQKSHVGLLGSNLTEEISDFQQKKKKNVHGKMIKKHTCLMLEHYQNTLSDAASSIFLARLTKRRQLSFSN